MRNQKDCQQNSILYFFTYEGILELSILPGKLLKSLLPQNTLKKEEKALTSRDKKGFLVYLAVFGSYFAYIWFVSFDIQKDLFSFSHTSLSNEKKIKKENPSTPLTLKISEIQTDKNNQDREHAIQIKTPSPNDLIVDTKNMGERLLQKYETSKKESGSNIKDMQKGSIGFAVPPEGYRRVWIKEPDYQNLRSAPNGNAPILAQLPTEEIIFVESSDEKWIKAIRQKDGMTGYVYREMLGEFEQIKP